MDSLLIATALTVLGGFIVLWLVSIVVRDASIVDPIWGIAFPIITWEAYAIADNPGLPQLFVAIAVTAWGVRLSVYLAIRNLGQGEDYRYQAMRRRWGRRFPLVSLGTVFILQAVLAWIVSLPAQVTMLHSGDLGPVVLAGFVLWFTGLSFETVGDWQLFRFKEDPSHREAVMDRGLWRFTRHPNYFGDFLVWWGLFLMAVNGVSMLWTAVGPLLMSILLLRVSGVAPLERAILQRRPGYESYIRRTSRFIPRPPRKSLTEPRG